MGRYLVEDSGHIAYLDSSDDTRQLEQLAQYIQENSDKKEKPQQRIDESEFSVGPLQAKNEDLSHFLYAPAPQLMEPVLPRKRLVQKRKKSIKV